MREQSIEMVIFHGNGNNSFVCHCKICGHIITIHVIFNVGNMLVKTLEITHTGDVGLIQVVCSCQLG